jgi:drug/metabolite transporter (DMT)-like permease
MEKKGLFMIGGGILSLGGIIFALLGYNKFQSGEGSLTVMVNGTPPGVADFIIGILIAVAGVFMWIYGFGLFPEEPKMRERVTRDMPSGQVNFD